MNTLFVIISLFLSLTLIHGFSSPLSVPKAYSLISENLVGEKSDLILPESLSPVQVVSSVTGEGIEIPELDSLFSNIYNVSPLAKSVSDNNNGKVSIIEGFASIDFNDRGDWMIVEQNNDNMVHSIEKRESFNGIEHPIYRFRSTIPGVCDPFKFANLIMDVEDRKKWDQNVAHVEELHPVFEYGHVDKHLEGTGVGSMRKLGVGYCRTKGKFGIPPREQLTLCGIQEFGTSNATSHGGDYKSYIIWGKELNDDHNFLFPQNTKRGVRSRNHLFSITMVPTTKNSYDVEYVYQVDIGGSLPNWLTSPIVIDSIKQCFRYAHQTPATA